MPGATSSAACSGRVPKHPIKTAARTNPAVVSFVFLILHFPFFDNGSRNGVGVETVSDTVFVPGLRAKSHSGIRARKILLVAVGHMPVIAEEIDSLKPIL